MITIRPGPNMGTSRVGLSSGSPEFYYFHLGEEIYMRRSVDYLEFPRIFVSILVFVLFVLHFWFNNTLLLLPTCAKAPYWIFDIENRRGRRLQVYNP